VVVSNNWWRKWQVYAGIVLLFNVAGFLYYIHFSIVNGYLPSPFLYDKSDTFMDLFNALHWAYDDGRYTDWGSIYPPLSFFILKFINFVCAGREHGAPAIMRENSQFVIAGFCLIYLAVPAVVLKTRSWQDFQRIEKCLIYFVIVLSAPMLFTLERGNLILLTPILLAFTLSKIGITRSVCIALLINVKPYFALLMIYYIARKNLKWFTICFLLSGLIFAISGVALDDHFFVFFTNMFNFSQEAGLFSLREVMAMPSSVSSFSYVLKNPAGAMLVSGHLNSPMIAIFVYIIETVKWIVLVISLAVVVIRSRQMRDAEIISLLVVAICNLGIWVGGYTYILYIALIPVFIKMCTKWLYIGLILLIAIPLDTIPLLSDFIGEQYSYLAAAHVNIWWTLGLGSVIRPIANLILLLLLSCEFLARKNESACKNVNFDVHPIV